MDEPEPDHIDRALLRIAADYPKGIRIRDLPSKDQETVLALMSIPRKPNP